MRPALFAVLLALAAPAAADDDQYRRDLTAAFVNDTAVPDESKVSSQILREHAGLVRSVQMGCGERDFGCTQIRLDALKLIRFLGVAKPEDTDLGILSAHRALIDRYALRNRVRHERALAEYRALADKQRAQALSAAESQRLARLSLQVGGAWKSLDAGALPAGDEAALLASGAGPRAGWQRAAIEAYLKAPPPGVDRTRLTSLPMPPTPPTGVTQEEMQRVCAFDIAACQQMWKRSDQERMRQAAIDCAQKPLGCEALGFVPIAGDLQNAGNAAVTCRQGIGVACGVMIGVTAVGVGPCNVAAVVPGAKGACKAGLDAAGAAVIRAAGQTAEIGAQLLGRHGVPVSKEMAERIAASERAVAELNGAYRTGYHGAGHQVGQGSVADLSVRSAGLDKLVRPEGMSQKTFDEVRAKFYLGALVHDVEGVVVVRQGERTFIKYADSTKTRPIDISQLGAPVSVQRLPDGSEKLIYAKAPDSRSNLLTTMRMLNESPTLAAANDPLAKWMALKGTAFSPQEKALADRMLPILEAKIRQQYGNEADAVLRMAGPLADKMGVADVFNHYVRDTASAVRQMQSLEKEFANPAMVNVRGTFGFFEFVVAKDEKLIKGFSGLPAAEQEAFRRNLVAFSLLQKNPGLLSEGVENAAQRLARSPEVDAIIKANPQWANLSLPELIQAAKGAKSSALTTEARELWRKANGELIERNLSIASRETREQAIRQQMPALKDEQVRAVLEAHERFPCRGEGCGFAQLSGKYELLSRAQPPLTPQQMREVLDRGLAGTKTPPVVGGAMDGVKLTPGGERLANLMRTQSVAEGALRGQTPMLNGVPVYASQPIVGVRIVSEYVQEMRAGRWDWSKMTEKIRLAYAPDGKLVVVGGHHRVVAAHYANKPIPRSAYEIVQKPVSAGEWSTVQWNLAH